jgi:hypothetical protein
VEDYFKHGTDPTRPEAKALLGLCPPRADHLIPEAEFTLAWPGEDALLRGKIDLVDPTQDLVIDHKTTSSIDRYAKSQDDLTDDAQAILYGVAYRAVFKNIDTIRLQWNYVKREQPKTRPPQTRAVPLTQTLAMLEAGLVKWRPVVADLVQIAKRRPKAEAVDPSPGEACFKYGGCHYRDRCADYAGNRKVKETPPMNPAVLARLAALSAGTPAPLPDFKVSTDTIIDDEASAILESRQIATPPTTVAPPPNMPLLDSVRIALDIAPAVVPPDAQPDVSPNDPPPPPLVEVKRGRGRPKKDAAVTKTADDLRQMAAEAETRVTAAPPPVTISTTPEASLELVDFVTDVIVQARRDGDLNQRLQAATLALGLIQFGAKS